MSLSMFKQLITKQPVSRLQAGEHDRRLLCKGSAKLSASLSLAGALALSAVSTAFANTSVANLNAAARMNVRGGETRASGHISLATTIGDVAGGSYDYFQVLETALPFDNSGTASGTAIRDLNFDGLTSEGAGQEPPIFLAQVISSSLIDTDQDNIANSVDIDDDNDGILDINEGWSAHEINGTLATKLINGVNQTGNSVDLEIGDVIRYQNIDTVNGTSLDAVITLLEVQNLSGTGYVQSEGSGAVLIRDQINRDARMRIRVDLVESGTNTVFPFPYELDHELRDIDSSSRDGTEVVGTPTGLPFRTILGANLQAGGFANDNSPPSGFDYYRVDPATAGNPTDWLDEINDTTNSDDYAVFLSYNVGFSSTELVFGLTGGSGNNSGRGLNPLIFRYELTRDSDRDGFPDHLDLDSDNDGITDNVEAQATAAYIEPSGKGAAIADGDQDGLDDRYDMSTSRDAAISIGLSLENTDNDTLTDYLDPDSDGDNLDDITERGDDQPTSITDTTDTDQDGLLDIFEGADNSDDFDVNDENLDNTDTNFLLADSDNDTAADGSGATPLTADLDYRDVPLFDFSDAPSASYGTASHMIVNGFYIGSGNPDTETVAEQGGDAGAGADGDDANGATPDDEDGVTLPALTQGQSTTIDVTVAGTGGYLQGWIDWNGDGDFGDADEQIATNLQDGDADGSISVPVSVPAAATTNQTYARFRWSTTSDLNTTTIASDGEVEDYAVAVAAPALPPFTACPVDTYQVKSTAQNIDSQLLGVNLITGSETIVDNDLDFSVNALGFNRKDSYIYGIDFNTDRLIQIGSNYEAIDLGVVVGLPRGSNNNTQYDAGDVDKDGILHILNDANNTIYRINVDSTSVDFKTLLSPLSLGLSANTLNDVAFHPDASTDGKFYLFGVGRNGTLYKINPDTGSPQSLGSIGRTGEFGASYFDAAGFLYISDNTTGNLYRIDLTNPDISSAPTAILFSQGTPASLNDGARCATAPIEIDFGDAPDLSNSGAGDYSTLLSSDGPRHEVDNTVFLGNGVSSDTDGFADGSDNNGNASDDANDDGLQLNNATLQGQTLTAGDTVTLDVTTAGSGVLNAWIDWNGDGDFTGTDEQIATDADVSGGTLSVTVPAGATVGTTYARFRYSSDTGLGPTGAASDGEVEDYQVAIAPVSTNPDVVLVKRITAINDATTNPNDSTDLTGVVNDGTANSADDEDNWPNNYLLGELDAGLVKPGDRIEYAVYFLNTGDGDAETVRICDWIQPNQSLVTGLYGESSAGALDGNDVELSLGGTTYQLTTASDAADRAVLTTVGDLGSLTPNLNCNLPAGASNGDSVLVLDITGTTGDPTGLTTLPGTTGQGTPTNAYGFFRFTTQVDE